MNSPVKGFHQTSVLNAHDINYEKSPDGIF
jgi:hypothetical protein